MCYSCSEVDASQKIRLDFVVVELDNGDSVIQVEVSTPPGATAVPLKKRKAASQAGGADENDWNALTGVCFSSGHTELHIGRDL